MSEWISIKDKLPTELPCQSIFIVAMYSHYKHKIFVEPLRYISNEWFAMFDEEPLDSEYEVTHWMPLPELPIARNKLATC